MRHGLKVSDSLLSASVLEGRIKSKVCDTLCHTLAVLDECVVYKLPVVAVVVLHHYA